MHFVSVIPLEVLGRRGVPHEQKCIPNALHSTMQMGYALIMTTDPHVISATAFFLADHAEAVNGKLYVVGGCFDRLFSPGPPPIIHPHMSVVTTLSVPWSATNQRHSLSLKVEDEDGSDALPPDAFQREFEAGRPPGMRSGDSSLLPVVFNINELRMERFGPYLFHLLVDGTAIAEARLKVENTSVATLQAG